MMQAVAQYQIALNVFDLNVFLISFFSRAICIVYTNLLISLFIAVAIGGSSSVGCFLETQHDKSVSKLAQSNAINT